MRTAYEVLYTLIEVLSYVIYFMLHLINASICFTVMFLHYLSKLLT